MQYVTLGRTGLRVSKLAIGTNALSSKYDPDITPGVFNWLLDQGVNYIGTGNMYGDCQTYLRRMVMQRRAEFYISGKGGILPARDIVKGIEAGLYWLGIDCFDVWELDCLRSPEEVKRALEPGGTLEGVQKAQAQGKVRFIGVTSHCPEYANALIETDAVDTAMFFANPIFPYGVREVLPVAHRHGVGTLGMRPSDHGQLLPYEQVFLWSLHSGVDVTISGMYTMDEARQNVALANRAVSAEEAAALDAEFSAVPEHHCHNCFRCKCPFNIPVQRFATYLAWHQAYGLVEGLEATLKAAAVRAKDFIAFCDACRLCDAQCPYGVPLSDLTKQAVAIWA